MYKFLQCLCCCLLIYAPELFKSENVTTKSVLASILAHMPNNIFEFRLMRLKSGIFVMYLSHMCLQTQAHVT